MLMLARLTIREAMAKKTFMAFFLASTVFLLIIIFAFQLDIVKNGEAALNFVGTDDGDAPIVELEEFVKTLIGFSSVAIMTAGIFLSIFATAGLIPSMLEKGSIDLILSKPMSRLNILLARSGGALLVVFFNITYLILGLWIILGLKTGVWIVSFLIIIPVICLVFLIIFCWMALWGILLNNSALTIMLTYIMFGISGLLLARNQIYALLSSKIWGYILDGLYYLFPRISEMMQFPIQYFKEDTVMSFEAFTNSGIVAIVIFGVAAYLFQKRDF
ncbi:MAG: hypothetical protein KDD94_08000 [Calditrichaeota bacterium]|nr:hypothetical protein [Calditrichota bacterium]